MKMQLFSDISRSLTASFSKSLYWRSRWSFVEFIAQAHERKCTMWWKPVRQLSVIVLNEHVWTLNGSQSRFWKYWNSRYRMAHSFPKSSKLKLWTLELLQDNVVSPFPCIRFCKFASQKCTLIICRCHARAHDAFRLLRLRNHRC